MLISNPYRIMMRILLATCFLITCLPGWAQDEYFLCIQSDNHQPFYARIGEKSHASSAVGHLVIPGLKDSTYRVYIGFPQRTASEQQFKVVFNQQDLGFRLKKGEGSDWGLENWVSGELLKPQDYGKEYVDDRYLGQRKQNDAFAGLMAAVVNDSAVLYSTVVQAPPSLPVVSQGTAAVTAPGLPAPQDSIRIDSAVAIGTATVAPLPASDSAVSADTAIALVDSAATLMDTALATAPVVAPDSTAAQAKAPGGQQEEKPASGTVGVRLLEEQAAKEGRKLVFRDGSSSGADTIAIIIPFDKELAAATDSAAALAKTPAGKIDTSAGEPADDAWKKKLVLMNSDCVNIATDHDVDKLRVKILDETNTEDRVDAAKKFFRNKCLMTRQVRALSELFINDEGRYEFFRAAYPFTADTGRFKELVDLLTEEVYIARFKTLVRISD